MQQGQIIRPVVIILLSLASLSMQLPHYYELITETLKRRLILAEMKKENNLVKNLLEMDRHNNLVNVLLLSYFIVTGLHNN